MPVVVSSNLTVPTRTIKYLADLQFWQILGNLPVRIERQALPRRCLDAAFPDSPSEAICQFLANCFGRWRTFSFGDETFSERRAPSERTVGRVQPLYLGGHDSEGH